MRVRGRGGVLGMASLTRRHLSRDLNEVQEQATLSSEEKRNRGNSKGKDSKLEAWLLSIGFRKQGKNG